MKQLYIDFNLTMLWNNWFQERIKKVENARDSELEEQWKYRVIRMDLGDVVVQKEVQI